MGLVADAKEFLRGVVNALDVALDRVERIDDPTKRVVLTSQLIGSCDSVITILHFLGESVPGMSRFSTKGRTLVTDLRNEARRMRNEAGVEVGAAVETEPDIQPDPTPPAPDSPPPQTSGGG